MLDNWVLGRHGTIHALVSRGQLFSEYDPEALDSYEGREFQVVSMTL
jgi:hypothetical protein